VAGIGREEAFTSCAGLKPSSRQASREDGGQESERERPPDDQLLPTTTLVIGGAVLLDEPERFIAAQWTPYKIDEILRFAKAELTCHRCYKSVCDGVLWPMRNACRSNLAPFFIQDEIILIVDVLFHLCRQFLPERLVNLVGIQCGHFP